MSTDPCCTVCAEIGGPHGVPSGRMHVGPGCWCGVTAWHWHDAGTEPDQQESISTVPGGTV